MKNRIKLSALSQFINTEGLDKEAPVIRKQLSISDTVAKIEEGEHAAIQWISTKSVDADSEIIDPAGVDFSRFLKNPVVLLNHDYHSLPVGKAEGLEVDPTFGVKAKTIFADTAVAKDVYSLVKGGFMGATSIGFIPKEWIESTDKGWGEAVKSYSAKWGMAPEAFTAAQRIYTNILLLEYSQVTVPSNEDSLTIDVKSLSPELVKLLKIEDAPAEEVVPEALTLASVKKITLTHTPGYIKLAKAEEVSLKELGWLD